MNVRSRAPMSPCNSDVKIMTQEEQDNLDPRPRKNSESYREIAAVDSNDDFVVISGRAGCPLVGNGKNRIAEDASEEQIEGSNDEDIFSDLPSSCDVSTSSVLSKISGGRELDHDNEDFLYALPVAMATSEMFAAPAIISTAATVVRVRSSHATTHRDASLISVKVYKPTKETKLGIRLSMNRDGHLQFAQVAGMMKESPFRLGDELLRINGQDVSAWTTTKTLHYLREAWGWVSLTIRNPNSSDSALALASVCKSSIDDRLGISFCSAASKLTVNSLNVAGLLGGRTTIRMGDVVESINSISSAHLDNATAVNIIRSVPDWVHILVRKPALRECDGNPVIVFTIDCGPESLTSNDDERSEESTIDVAEATEVVNSVTFEDGEDLVEPALLSVTLTKTEKSERLGFSLSSADNTLYIKTVSSGALSGSCLKEGMMLLAINHQSTSRMTVSEASSYIRNRVGSITLLARNPHGNPMYVRAVAFKKASERQNLIGVSFKGSSGRQLKICEIRKHGLFFNSALHVGDSVVQINDIPCCHWRPKEAVELVRASERIVSVLVKSKSKTGVVVGKLPGTPVRTLEGWEQGYGLMM